MKRSKAFSPQNQGWLPPISPATIIGAALFIVYVGSAVFSAIPVPFRSTDTDPTSLYTRSEELAYCQALAPPEPCFTNATKTIYVQPYGGLGNRLRAVASAMALSKEAGANVVIVWMEKEQGFRGAWRDLFAEPNIPIGCFPGDSLRPPSSKCKVHRINHYNDWETLKNKTSAWQHIDGQDVLCIQSMMFLTEKLRGIKPFYANLKPVASIQKAIDSYKKQVGWNEWGQWVGVHIRRTDLRLKCNTADCRDGVKAEDVLPLAAYTEVLKTIIRLAKSVEQPRFYLATDDPETEVAIREALSNAANLNEENGGCVSYTKAVRDVAKDNWEMRNQLAGVQEAVIDMWLLSETKFLVGTVGSTFSQTPKLIGSPFFVSVGSEFENKF